MFALQDGVEMESLQEAVALVGSFLLGSFGRIWKAFLGFALLGTVWVVIYLS